MCLALELCLVPGLFQSLAQWPGVVSHSPQKTDWMNPIVKTNKVRNILPCYVQCCFILCTDKNLGIMIKRGRNKMAYQYFGQQLQGRFKFIKRKKYVL